MAQRDPLAGLREALDDPARLRAWAVSALAAEPPRPRRTERRGVGRRWLLVAAVLGMLATALHSQATLGPMRPEVALVNGQPVLRGVVADNAEQRMGAAMLETSVTAELLRQAAERAGVAPSEADIDAALERVLAEQFRGDTERFEGWRRSGGRRDSVLRREVAAQLAAFRLRSRGIKLSEGDLRTYYTEHRDRYGRPESYFYRIIYVPWPERDGGRAPEAQALAVARAELDKIRRGEDFAAAARRVSEDPNAERNGGHIGPQPADLLPDLFRPYFRDAKAGQIIDEPVLFGSRFVLLQFLSHTEAFAGEFDQVRAQVESDYLMDKLPPQGKFLTNLVRAAKIEITDPRYEGQAITGRWFSPSGISLDGWLVSE